jgi:hypothetical protein
VICGIISPSHEAYVCHKNVFSLATTLPSATRLNLCEQSIFDFEEKNEVEPLMPVLVSSWECSQRSFVDFPGVQEAHLKELRKHHPSVNVLYLCGGDHYRRTCPVERKNTVVVNRPGTDLTHSETVLMKNHFVIKIEEGNCLKLFTFNL